MLGWFGGSFDPVHNGHLHTALELLDRLPLDQLNFLPARLSPLKEKSAEPRHRLAMLRLALAGQPRLGIDTRELDRPPPSYTIDTVRDLRAEFGPVQPLAFILGLDSVLALPRWRDWRHLTEHVHLIVVTRPGYVAEFTPELQEWLNSHRCNDAQLLEYRPNGWVVFLPTRPHDLSSTALRARLAAGLDPGPALPPPVADYIRLHHLYGATASHES